MVKFITIQNTVASLFQSFIGLIVIKMKSMRIFHSRNEITYQIKAFTGGLKIRKSYFCLFYFLAASPESKEDLWKKEQGK